MHEKQGNYNAECKFGSWQQGLMRYPSTTKSLKRGEIEKNTLEKTILQKEMENMLKETSKGLKKPPN